MFATERQKDYILHLLYELGYDLEDYERECKVNFDCMTKAQASAIIDSLKNEMEGYL